MPREDEDDIWESAPKRVEPSVIRPPSAEPRGGVIQRFKAYLVEQRVGGGRRLALPPAGEFVLGSGQGSDFWVQDSLVQDRHVAIKAARTRYFVEVIAQEQGTFVNEEPVESTRRLEDGDRLRIGDTVFLVQYVQACSKS